MPAGLEGTRKRNPLINSARGGRALSTTQLPFFLARPPAGFGVLTTTGRRTGKRRRRCIRAIRDGDRVYVVAMKGARTAWLKNALANPSVELRIRGGTFRGLASSPADPGIAARARETYTETVNPFDYLECMIWRSGRPSAAKVRELHRVWFDRGAALVIELDGG